MFRRQFLKLLGALPLALALRLPIAESKSQPIWQSSGGSPGSDPESMAAYIRRKWELSEPTIYVNSCGSDANDGLTPETPKRTIAAAVEATSEGMMAKGWRFKKNPTNDTWELWKDDLKCGRTICHPILLVDRDIVSRAEIEYLERHLHGKYYGGADDLDDFVVDGDIVEKAAREIEKTMKTLET